MWPYRSFWNLFAVRVLHRILAQYMSTTRSGPSAHKTLMPHPTYTAMCEMWQSLAVSIRPVPSNPGKQTHVPFTHVPAFEQLLRHGPSDARKAVAFSVDEEAIERNRGAGSQTRVAVDALEKRTELIFD